MSINYISVTNPAGMARMQETVKANIAQGNNTANLTDINSAPSIANETNSSQGNIEKAIKDANEMLQKVNTVSLSYSVDQETHIEVIKVIDNQTGETVKQIPSKDIVGMIDKMYEMWGILVDKKA